MILVDEECDRERSVTCAQAGNMPRQERLSGESFRFSGNLSLPSHPEPGPSGTATSEPGPSGVATSEPGPSGTASGSPAYNNEIKDLDTLISMFSTRYTAKQIQVLYKYAGDSFDNCIDCLTSGLSLESILRMVNVHTSSYKTVKVAIDQEDMWADMLALYKTSDQNMIAKRIRVMLDDSPVVDTCGVRKQVYTTVFAEFVQNKHVRLFDGPANYVRPFYSAEARCSGLFKVLGTMVGHSILQDGVGFPYYSPVAYWYMVSGEEKALEYVNINDVGGDTACAITKVCMTLRIILECCPRNCVLCVHIIIMLHTMSVSTIPLITVVVLWYTYSDNYSPQNDAHVYWVKMQAWP